LIGTGDQNNVEKGAEGGSSEVGQSYIREEGRQA